MTEDSKEEGRELSPFLQQLCTQLIMAAPGVDEEPTIELIDWCVKEDTAGNLYFVGSRSDDWSGRASTPIVEWHPDLHVGRTRSGRVYGLIGPPGHSKEGEHVWSIVKAVYKIEEAKK